jgi:hypothetical protein
MALSEPPQFLAANGQVCTHSVPIMLSVSGSALAVSERLVCGRCGGGLITGLTDGFVPGSAYFTLNEAEDRTEYGDVRLLPLPLLLSCRAC